MGLPVLVIASTSILKMEDGSIEWAGPLAVDGDGSPNCYSPHGSGLVGRDSLANAGHPGDWYGIATDTGQPDGQPIIQTLNDPCPGFYVSTTALQDHTKHPHDPHRYVDASKIPYVSVPPQLVHRLGVHMGDVALVTYCGQRCTAIVADVGPSGAIGEGSIALARALGLNPSPIHGGTGGGVRIRIWPGSSQGWPRLSDAIDQQVALLTAAPSPAAPASPDPAGTQVA